MGSPWECVKAYRALSEYTKTADGKDCLRDHIQSVLRTCGLDPKQGMSAFATCQCSSMIIYYLKILIQPAAQSWKITGSNCLRELGTDIAVKHGFPQEVAASFGKCFVGEKPE